MKTKDYIRFQEYLPISLDGMYSGNKTVLNNLDENIKRIIMQEYPITLNTLKQRLREALNVGKISQKALDIILESITKQGFSKTDNLYDFALWPQNSAFEVNVLRINSDRQIYDIPYQEMALLVNYLNLSGEELYRAILKYFGYEVLTKKALVYLEFVEAKIKTIS